MPIPSVSSGGAFLTAQTDLTVNTNLVLAGTGPLLLVVEQSAYTNGVGLIAPKLDGIDMLQVGALNGRLSKWVALTSAATRTLSTRCAGGAYDAHQISWRTWQDTATSGARYQNAQPHDGADNNPRTGSLTCPAGGALDAGFVKLYNGAGALTIDSAGGNTSTGGSWAGGTGGAWGGGYRTTDGPIAWAAGDANQWYVNSLEILGDAPAGPVITGPSGAATGPTQATIGITTDTAPTTTAISYQILPAATAAPDAATIVGAPTGTISTGSAGALTAPITGLTTNTAVKVHFAQGASSNVASSASFTPATLASSGSLSAQSGTAGGSITWAGVTPQSLLTNTGIGSGSWSIVSSAGFSVAPSINATTGVLSGGTLAAAGTYAPQIRYTDSSTVPSAQTITHTLSLTVSASGDTTPPTLGGSITIGTVTSSSIQASWSAGADNVAVTSYEVSSNGGGSYTDVGSVLTHTFSGLTPSTSYPLRVRAKDAAGLVSSPLSATQSTSAAGTAPSITSQPSSQTVVAGATASFSVGASGSGILTYQWRRGGVNISGATSSTYNFATVLGDSGATFDCVVTGDTSPPATSNAATLTVTALPTGGYLNLNQASMGFKYWDSGAPIANKSFTFWFHDTVNGYLVATAFASSNDQGIISSLVGGAGLGTNTVYRVDWKAGSAFGVFYGRTQ